MYFFLKRKFSFSLVIIAAGYLIPGNVSSPIQSKDIIKIDPESFWYYPWGTSGVHKGIDIFCKKHAFIISPVSGFIISKNYGTISGNYIYIIGPQWRTYYFAHMDTTFVNAYTFIKRGEIIGRAGNTGNAAGKPVHLHFTIQTLFPYIWLYNSKDVEGWKKMFYLDPLKQLNF